LGAAIDSQYLSNFISSVKGCVIDLTECTGFNNVLDDLYDVMTQPIPITEWKRVNKRSLSNPNGGQIEYTSSSVNSIHSWMNLYKKVGNPTSQLPILLNHLETLITQTISQFSFQSKGHVVCLKTDTLKRSKSQIKIIQDKRRNKRQV
jgi:hypothetical protein